MLLVKRSRSQLKGRNSGTRRGKSVLLGVIFTLCVGMLTQAASYLPVSLKQLTNRASAVVEVDVVGLRTTEPGDPRGVRTLVELEVVQSWKGSLPAKFTLDLPGGRRGEIIYHVPDIPLFSKGERAVVFVKQPAAGRYMVQDLGLGKFDIVTHAGIRHVENKICPTAIRGTHKDGSELAGRSIPFKKFDALITQYAAGKGSPEEAKALAKTLPAASHQHFPPMLTVAPQPQAMTSFSKSNIWWALLASVSFLIALGLFLKMRMVKKSTTARRAATLLTLIGILGLWALPGSGAGVVEAFSGNGTTWDLDNTRTQIVENQRMVWTPVLESQTNSTVFTIVQGTYDQWEDVPQSRIAFTQAAQETDPGAPFDNDGRNVQTWTTNPSDDFSQNTLGITFTIFSSGSTIESDIIYNDRDFNWTDNLVLSTALHEIGHQIGLDHVNDTSAVMHPTNQGLEKLSADEIDGAQQLYPDANDPGSTTDTGSGGTGSGSIAAPTASLSADPTSGTAPLLSNFDGTASFAAAGATITTFAWDFGDGQTGSGSTISHTFNDPGRFTVTLTITDDQNQQDSSQMEVQVGDSSTVVAGNFKVDFRKANKDKFLVKIQSDQLIGIKAERGTGGALIDGTLQVGGASFPFRFDREKAASLSDPNVKIKVKDKTGLATVLVKNASLQAEMEVWGVTNEDVKNKPVSISVYLDIPLLNLKLWTIANFTYTARLDRNGRGKN